MNKKAIVLLSGGLDSILATKLMLEQGVEVLCVNFYIEFAVCGGKGLEGPTSPSGLRRASAADKAAKMLGVPFKIVDITEEYLEMFKNPKHGYGANINPCIDCKIFMLKKAKVMMEEAGASFLVTGEVLGERPMSQRLDALNIIEKQAGVRGILLRPLTAKLLAPTLPEKEGLVDREKLLDIRGRSRKPQIALAEKFGIKEYPNPAGGCLLTDPGFTDRIKDLIKHGELSIDNLKLLKVGRHFRITENAKLAVGRDDGENEELLSIADKNDIIFQMRDIQGPISILRGKYDDDLIKRAASIATYHTKSRNENSVAVTYWRASKPEAETAITVKPASADEAGMIRI